MSLAGLGFRNSFRKPLRTSLSVLGIALCIVLMLTVTAVSARYATVVDQSYSIYNPDLMVVSKGAFLVGGLPLGAVVPQGIAAEVASVPGVTSAIPILFVVDVQDLVPANITIGVPAQDFGIFAGATPLRLEGDYPAGADQAVIGSLLSSTTGLRVGSSFEEGGTNVTVTGIIHTSNVVLSDSVVMPLPTAQAVSGYHDLISAVLVDAGNSTAGVAAGIESSIAGVGVLPYGESQAVTAPLLSSVGAFDSAMGALSAALAVLFVVLIVSVNILEERDELSTMVAIGASIGSVMKATLAETGLVTLAGVAAGVLASGFATGLVFASYASLPVPLSLPGLSILYPASATLLAVLGILAAGIVVGIGATLAVVRGME